MRRNLQFAAGFGLALACLAMTGFQGGASQTVAVTYPFNISSASTYPLVTPDVPNVGQSAHQAYVCNFGSGATRSISGQLEASYDDVHFFAISPNETATSTSTLSPTCFTVTAQGYYPAVHFAITNGTGWPGTPVVGAVTAQYSGSSSANPVAGETRSSSAATKVSQIPTTSQCYDGALKSTAYQCVAASTISANVPLGSNYVYEITVDNPNTGTVYLQIGNNSTVATHQQAIFAVPANNGTIDGVLNLTLSNPLYSQMLGRTSADGLYIACSTSPSTAADPSSACIAQLLLVANAGTTYNGVAYPDNGPGAIPQ